MPFGFAPAAHEIPAVDEFYFQWHITEQCNQRCLHCYHEGYRAEGELEEQDLLAVAAKMVEAAEKWGRVGSFSLTGGEPFLRRRELFSIARYLDDRPAAGYYDILTNGSLIEDGATRDLAGLAKLRRVQLSFEGATAESNDRVRGAGTYARTMEAVQRLKGAGLEVSVMTTLTRSNAAEIPVLIDRLEAEGVDTFAIERFIPEGQGADMAAEALTPQEIGAAFEAVYQAGRLPRPMRVLLYRPLFCLLDSEDPTVGAMCSIGANALTILHDGTVLPCRRLPIPIGNILSDSFFKIWYDSPLLWEVRNPANLKGKCGQCNVLAVCRGCRAAAFACTGDYLAEDPQCWK